MDEKYGFMSLKEGDTVYVRKWFEGSAKTAEQLKYRKATVIMIKTEPSTVHWTHHEVDVDWGYQGSTSGSREVQNLFIMIDNPFYDTWSDNRKLNEDTVLPLVFREDSWKYRPHAVVTSSDGQKYSIHVDDKHFKADIRVFCYNLRRDADNNMKQREELMKKYNIADDKIFG